VLFCGKSKKIAFKMIKKVNFQMFLFATRNLTTEL